MATLPLGVETRRIQCSALRSGRHVRPGSFATRSPSCGARRFQSGIDSPQCCTPTDPETARSNPFGQVCAKPLKILGVEMRPGQPLAYTRERWPFDCSIAVRDSESSEVLRPLAECGRLCYLPKVECVRAPSRLVDSQHARSHQDASCHGCTFFYEPVQCISAMFAAGLQYSSTDAVDRFKRHELASMFYNTCTQDRLE